jgi:hypothetical protein
VCDVLLDIPPVTRRRRPDTGMVRPYRPVPADFRETYLRMGWDGIEEHYGANYRCIARWIEESGGDALRAERAALSGGFVRPRQRSKRYVLGRTLTAVRAPGGEG